jgi:hypothetical protein
MGCEPIINNGTRDPQRLAQTKHKPFEASKVKERIGKGAK